MKRSRLPAIKCLSAAVVLALLAGCANGFDPVKIVIAPVTELLQQLDNAKSEQAADAKPAPAAPKPPPVKDVGLFGNFEIGAGFGTQKASRFTGTLPGVTDGPLVRRIMKRNT